MPFPVELLRFFDRAAPRDSLSPASGEAEDAAGPPPALPAAATVTQPASVAQAVPLNGSSKTDTTG